MNHVPVRRFFDADSHVLEPNDWLRPYADPAIRDRLRTLTHPQAPSNEEAADIVARRSSTDREHLCGTGYKAFGAWSPTERSAVLDEFGIDAQLVFSTFAPGQFLSDDLDLLYGGVRAHTRALADFCSHDPRLLAAPLVPFTDVDRAITELEVALETGCGAILVQTRAPSKTMGPSHVALDPFWARLQDADVPFVTHVGTGGRLVPTGYRENGRPVPPDFLGGERTSDPRTSSTSATGQRTFFRHSRSMVSSSGFQGCGARRSNKVLSGCQACSRSLTVRCSSLEPSLIWLRYGSKRTSTSHVR